MVGDFCLSSSGRSSEGAVLVFFFVFLGAAYTFVYGGYKYVLIVPAVSTQALMALWGKHSRFLSISSHLSSLAR